MFSRAPKVGEAHLKVADTSNFTNNVHELEEKQDRTATIVDEFQTNF